VEHPGEAAETSAFLLFHDPDSVRLAIANCILCPQALKRADIEARPEHGASRRWIDHRPIRGVLVWRIEGFAARDIDHHFKFATD
jgi:hypothetical protein